MAKRSKSAEPRTVEYGLPEQELTHPAPIAMKAIAGQERALTILCNALRSQRVHHAWIFHGPAGVGKFTTALSFAAALLDPTSRETKDGLFAAEKGSPTQRLLDAGTHPDLHVIVKELARYHEDSKVRDRKLTSIPIDVIRDFMLGPGYLGAAVRSESQAAKVFVVDEAELLNNASQNAVLKFLEEPPERTVVILVTSAEERLLPTIRSRCQRVFFPTLSDKDMAKWFDASGIDADKKHREWLLWLAAGAPGVAAAAHTGDLYAWWQRLEPMLSKAIRGGYSVELGPAMAELVEAWARQHVESHENASKEAANKAGADWMLRLVAAFLRDALRGQPADSPALAAIDALRRAEPEIDSNVALPFVFEKLSAEIAAAR